VDPAKRKPVKIILDPITSADAAPECSLHGRVVDPKGAPIEGAVVEMEALRRRTAAPVGRIVGN